MIKTFELNPITFYWDYQHYDNQLVIIEETIDDRVLNTTISDIPILIDIDEDPNNKSILIIKYEQCETKKQN